MKAKQLLTQFVANRALTKGPVTLSRIPHRYRPQFLPYVETDTDEGGSCKTFFDLPRIATDLLWSATVTQGQFCGCPIDCFFNPQTLSICQSIADLRLDLTMFLAIFAGTEASRMKGRPQGHPGWVYRQ